MPPRLSCWGLGPPAPLPHLAEPHFDASSSSFQCGRARPRRWRRSRIEREVARTAGVTRATRLQRCPPTTSRSMRCAGTPPSFRSPLISTPSGLKRSRWRARTSSPLSLRRSIAASSRCERGTSPSAVRRPSRSRVAALPAASTEPLPAVVQFQGYGGGRGLAHESILWAAAGYAHLVVDTRGQGSGWSTGDTADPVGSPPAHPGFMTQGILDPHGYYYRRVFVDAVRAVDAVSAHEAVDRSRIAVTGAVRRGDDARRRGARAGDLRRAP